MQKENKEEDHISIMTDPELHPLPISPNDPLQIVSMILHFVLTLF